MGALETDYLVVGAGASGMAFVDAMITASEFDLVLVDRRHRPGGHWNDAYPFVRLHQPSAYYGVNSRVLGGDAIDESGPNAGFYERADAAEICAYFLRVLDEDLLPSGRARFFGMHEYRAEGPTGHRLVSRLTGEETDVRVRRRLVDATYLESAIPATHTPTFEIEPGVRLLTPGQLVGLDDPGSGYTIIGAGKTAMDTITWLLDGGVEPDAIRWIKPRDMWTLDRAYWQPLDLLPALIEGVSYQLEAAAQAEGARDLVLRLEEREQFHRLDPEVEPETFRGATLSARERESLRRIENVVRLGTIARLGTDEIVLTGGSIPTDRGQVHVDCTAAGLNPAPARPVFEPGRITPQWIQWGVLGFSSALTGFVEATDGRSDAEKNRLCPTSGAFNTPEEWLVAFYTSRRAQDAWSEEPALTEWVRRSRLNVARGVSRHLEDERMQSALERLAANMEPALANLERLVAAKGRVGQPD